MHLADQLNQVLRNAIQAFEPSLAAHASRWEVPKDASFGDLSTPIGFKLAALQRTAPPVAAQAFVPSLERALKAAGADRLVDTIEVKQGFVNLSVSQEAFSDLIEQIRDAGKAYGSSRLGQGARVLIEFVSANPTGPLSVAHGRQAAVGDALARVLRSQGYDVVTEYYLNDEGRQIEMLGRSLRARYLQKMGRPEPFPEDGYHGLYVTEHAEALASTNGSLADAPLERFMELGMAEQLTRIKDDLRRFGLQFDTWESQRVIRERGEIEQALELLKARGTLFEQEGALWFASTQFGDDKDRVVRKQTGELTYLAPDIAYHRLKYARGFDQIINLWGPDHHGYIPRIKAAVTAMGLPAEKLTVRIVQLVTLSRHGKEVPMSKRQGEFVTFREIMDEVGVDATRFFYLMRTMESHLDFDLDLAKSQSQENPVYYVQYAHARICSILGNVRAQQPELANWTRADLAKAVEPEERLLLRQLFQFPMVVAACAHALEAHGVTTYLQRLAEVFHVFYTKCRVIGDDPAVSRARVALAQITASTLANGLALLGVSAPERM